jgi:hypothetical protein
MFTPSSRVDAYPSTYIISVYHTKLRLDLITIHVMWHVMGCTLAETMQIYALRFVCFSR